jgi:hypothetical protein
MSSEAHLPDDDPSHVGHFPGDPRFLGYILIPTKDDAKALQRNQWLSTHLLDSIIQRAGIRPDYSVDPFAPFLGSLGAETYISSMNLTASSQDSCGLEEESGENQATSREAQICYATVTCNHWGIISPYCSHCESA